MNCLGRLHRENPNEQNRTPQADKEGNGRSSEAKEEQEHEGMKEHNKFKGLQVV